MARIGVRRNLYHPEEVKEKIKTSQIINRLNSFVNGEIEMSAPQVTAALGLLKKTVPDLSAVEHSGKIDTRTEKDLTDAELAVIARSSSTGIAEQALSEKKPSEVH